MPRLGWPLPSRSPPVMADAARVVPPTMAVLMPNTASARRSFMRAPYGLVTRVGDLRIQTSRWSPVQRHRGEFFGYAACSPAAVLARRRAGPGTRGARDGSDLGADQGADRVGHEHRHQ